MSIRTIGTVTSEEVQGRGGLIDLAALETLSPEEASQVVRKDAVWPTPDWKKAIAEGMSTEAAALIKLIRDRIPVRPTYGVRQLGTHFKDIRHRPDEAVRQDYVKMLSTVRDRLMACRDVNSVRDARLNILESVGWGERCPPGVRHLVQSVWRAKQDTLQLDYRDLTKADTMIRNGWPGAASPTWRKGYSVRGDGEGGYLLTKGIRIIQDGFLNENAAWDWLQQSLEDQKDAKVVLPLPTKDLPETALRTGMANWRHGRDVETLEFLDTFGLRAIEFGKWVPHNERLTLLNNAYDALCDMAEAFDMPANALGLAGSLALSFGARSAGSAGADYDPRLRVIALPRSNSGGELARCWAKAFDHWCGEHHLQLKPAIPRLATGPLVGSSQPRPQTQHFEKHEAGLWVNFTNAAWKKDPETESRISTLRQEVARKEYELVSAQTRMEDYFKRKPQDRDTKEGKDYIEATTKWINNRSKNVIPKLVRQLTLLEQRAADAGESDFVSEARKLCGKEGSFWIRPTEIFARSVEAYVSDAIASLGGQNDFLVFGAEPYRFSQGFRGNPYPAGDERKRITSSVSELISTMVPRMVPSITDVPCEPFVADAQEFRLGL